VLGFAEEERRTRSDSPLPATNSVVQSKYGCFWLRGDSRYAKRKELLDTPARTRRWVRESVVRLVKALEALLAEGSVSSVGSVNVLRV